MTRGRVREDVSVCVFRRFTGGRVHDVGPRVVGLCPSRIALPVSTGGAL